MASTKPKAESKDQTIGVAELAKQIGTEPVELRKFLRSQDHNVGRGKRYQFTPKQAQAVKSSWGAAQKSE